MSLDQTELPITSHRVGKTPDLLILYTRQLAYYTAALAISTVLLFVATFIGVLITFWVAKSTKDLRDFAEQQATDTRDQMRLLKESVDAQSRQADATKILSQQAIAANKNALDAANAATTLANSARRASEIKDRAYVVLDDANLGYQRSTLQLRNIGATPAYQVRMNRRIIFIETTKFDASKFHPDTLSPTCTDDASAYLGAHDTSNWSLEISNQDMKESRAIKKTEITSFETGKSALIVSGQICYRDIFAHIHYTDFCWYYLRGNLHGRYFCGQDDFN